MVVGMLTHMCIDATVRAAVDLGFESSMPYHITEIKRGFS
ncbi:isochorismatase family protein [Mesobacillus maritimus]